ncbi:MAG: flagellar biosynthesis protein FlhF [Planctomycetes bacterium]|nr:flagellar biosynthesis protein FlhF [Planctomycetota bacterium]
MKLKTYHACSMAEALAAVKRDLGRDAVILHTRCFRKGGLFGVGGRQMWEITASRNVNVQPRRVRPLGPSVRRSQSAAPAVKVIDGPAVLPEPVAATALQAPPAGEELNRQVGALMQMVEKLVRRQEHAGAPAVPEELFETYLHLIQQEVAEDIAAELVAKVRQSLTGDQLRDKALIDARLGDLIASMIPTSITTIPPAKGRPHVIALVGPTGVGKTTTIAKLAANIKLRQKRRVGLVTLDTYRIAAVDQLRTYAQIIRVPLKVVTDPAELTEAIDALGDCDAILVDTAGRSPSDAERLDQLRAFLQAARPDEVHLVLATTANTKAIERAMERFGPLGVDRLILTKFDEAVSFGMVLGIVRRMNVALSFVTTGQDVPDDIEVSEGRRIAGMILSGTLQ